jgi:glycosyltransferase involved in cell wall biosynthesis
MMAFAGKGKGVLIIVENLPVPLDARVWQEATTLKKGGYNVSVICPTGKNYSERFIEINGIAIYRYQLPNEGSGPLGYLVEYGSALKSMFKLAIKVHKEKGFSIIQACNPPDLIFIVGLAFKLILGTQFVFDHHDINPELYLAKFQRKDFFYRIVCLCERLSFLVADHSIATNESYRKIAIERGKMKSQDVTVVRSGPSLDRMRMMPPDPSLKNGKEYLIGYIGVMGKQEGIDHLLEAARYLVHDKKRNDIQFVLIGGGTELEQMKKLCCELRLSDYVTFTGRIPDEPMLRILNTTDVCVNPDIYNKMNDKSTMNKIMEYMALGKPIVQYDLTEGRYSAQKASLYAERNNPIDMAEKIIYLLDNPDVREQMGLYGRNRVLNELQWSKEEPKYLSVYNRLASILF